MKVKCDYCGAMVDEDRTSCPNCGGKLNGVNRMASGEPRTIEDLRQWYQDYQLPATLGIPAVPTGAQTGKKGEKQ
ncbi:MAG: hypothetical protein IJK17_00125 [Lachnospiraceae bacterium]|nr:hypothetical protein [Lachnospiraceae bacterium]